MFYFDLKLWPLIWTFRSQSKLDRCMRKDPSLPFPGYIPQCRLNRGHCMLLSLVSLLACVFCVDGPLVAAFYRSFFPYKMDI
jgi:hypothetical protein